MFTNFKRVFQFALTDFYRNRGMSVAAVFVLMITMLLVTGLYFTRGINEYLVSSIQNKIDITAYFKEDAAEEDILQVKAEILQDSTNIKNVEYISKEQALANFNEKHQDNPVFSKALAELGDNPFLPSLNITTTGNDTAQYEKIAAVLNQEKFSAITEKVDFSEKKDIIESVFGITESINRFGMGLASVLMLIVVLVVFNTMKLIIGASSEEITTMRIVGATSWFIRLPFIIEGAMFGVVSFIFCFVVTALAAYFLSPILSVIMPGFSAFSYFVSHIWFIIMIQLGVGIFLGAISSYIVVRKYLRV